MSNSSGVNSHHEHLLRQFLARSSTNRVASLKSLDSVFQKRKSRLKDNHYTRDELKRELEETKNQVEADFEAELLHTTHSSFLLLRQLLAQAEKSNLKLFANFSETENRDLLNGVADFEKGISGNSLSDISGLEISSGELENSLLREENRTLQRAAQTANRDSTTLKELERELDSREKTVKEIFEASEREMEKRKRVEEEYGRLEGRMREITRQLSMREAELEKKFMNTNTYLNMHKIIKSKNTTIDGLRKTLRDHNIKDIQRVEDQEIREDD